MPSATLTPRSITIARSTILATISRSCSTRSSASAPVPLDDPENRSELCRLPHVKPARRFVGQRHARLGHEGPGQLHQATASETKGGDGGVGQFGDAQKFRVESTRYRSSPVGALRLRMSFHRRPVHVWARSAIIKWSRTVQSGKTSVPLVSPANAEPGPSVGGQVAQAASRQDDLAGVLIDLPAHTS